MYEKGNRIICVNDKFEPDIACLFKMLPEKGEIYTVRECTIGTTNPWNGAIHDNISFKVLLEELINDIDPCTIKGCQEEMGFASHRFVLPEQLSEEEEEKVFVGVGTDKKQDWWQCGE
jgi:hypothetical protein